MKYKLILTILIFLISNIVLAQSHDYVGAKKCKMCHNKPSTGAQYNSWEQTKHAKSMESLKGNEKNNPKCLKCHSTAFSVKPSSLGMLTLNEGVSCESCHGAGADYFQSSIMKSKENSMKNGLIVPDEKLCKKCHNSESPHFKGFDYESYLKKISHSNIQK